MKFGNVVSYRGEDYVYIVQIDTTIYLARICNQKDSDSFIGLRDRIFSKGDKIRQESPAWCFILLTTDQFKERIAHYGQELGKDFEPTDFLDIVGNLNEDDFKSLKNALLEDSMFVPKEVVAFIKKLP